MIQREAVITEMCRRIVEKIPTNPGILNMESGDVLKIIEWEDMNPTRGELSTARHQAVKEWGELSIRLTKSILTKMEAMHIGQIYPGFDWYDGSIEFTQDEYDFLNSMLGRTKETVG